MPETCIIIPCYNEAKRLDTDEFREFAASKHCAASQYGVVLQFVDDGSRDNTLDVLNRLASECGPSVTVRALGENVGKAEAVRLGMVAAIEAGFEFVGFWDADLATPLDAIPQFRNVLLERSDVEVVIGSRMPLLGRRIERHPIRSLCGRLFASTASIVLGMRVFDTQCGAKLFRVNEAMRRWVGVPFLSRWIFDVEIFARMQSLRRHVDSTPAPVRQAIYESPLDHWHDVAGSKLKGTDFLRAIGELMQILFRYRLSSRPSWLDQESTVSPVNEEAIVHAFELNSADQRDTDVDSIPTPIRPRRAA